MVGSLFVVRAGAEQRERIPLAEISGVETGAAPGTVAAELSTEQRERLEQARRHYDQNRLLPAITLLDGLRNEPGGDTYEVDLLLAMAQLRFGFPTEARRAAEAAAARRPGDADVHVLLGSLDRREDRLDSAIAHFRSATLAAGSELNNANVTWGWYQLGKALADAGYKLAAAQAYAEFDRAVWETHPEHRNAAEIDTVLDVQPRGALYRRLELLGELDLYDEALSATEAALERWPTDAGIVRRHAETLLAAGQPEAAFEFCRARLSDVEAGAPWLSVLVRAARDAGRLDAWVDELGSDVAAGRSLELARRIPAALLEIEAYASVLKLGAAILAQDASAMPVAWDVAAAHRALGDSAAAVETLIEFVRDNPKLPHLPRRYLLRWSAMMKADESVDTLLDRSVREADLDFAAHFGWGLTALARGRTDLAERSFQACTTSNPDFVPGFAAQAHLMLAQYNWNAARHYAEKLLETRPKLPAAHFILAEALAGLDENDAAEDAYRAAVRLDRREPEYALTLAQYYARAGNLRSAKRYFQEALALDPGNDAAFEGLIDAYRIGKNYELARSEFEKRKEGGVSADAIRRVQTILDYLESPSSAEHIAALRAQFVQHPEDFQTGKRLALNLGSTGRLDEALEVLTAARALNEDDYEIALIASALHSTRLEFGPAIEELETLLERYPNRLDLMKRLATTRLNDFRVESARELLEGLIERDHENAIRYRIGLIEMHLTFREYDAGLERVDALLADAPDDYALLAMKVRLLEAAERNAEAYELAKAWFDLPLDSGLWERAFAVGLRAKAYADLEKRLRALIDQLGDNAALSEMLIDVLLEQAEYDAAFEVARKFESSFEDDLLRRTWMGRCQALAGRREKAVSEFEALLALRTLKPGQRLEIWDRFVVALYDGREYDEALLRCEQWLAEAGQKREAPRVRALELKQSILLALGRDAEQVEVMEELLPYARTSVVFNNNLGYTWVDLGRNLKDATEMIRFALSRDPLNYTYLDSYGWAFYKTGDFEQARKYLERAVRVHPGGDGVIFEHLGDAVLRLDDRDAAREAWRSSIKLLEKQDQPLPIAEQRALDAVRRKLEALDRSERPQIAPTAAEQQEQTSP